MTCFLDGKVCENKTIHLISSVQLSSWKFAHGVRCGLKERFWCFPQLLAVDPSEWQPCPWAHQLVTTIWCHLQPWKGLRYGCWRGQLSSTESWSTLLATGFQVLINSYTLTCLIVTSPPPGWYKTSCINHCGGVESVKVEVDDMQGSALIHSSGHSPMACNQAGQAQFAFGQSMLTSPSCCLLL